MTTTGVIPPETVWNRMVRARTYAGLEQAEIAAQLGIARTSVSNYERGLRPVKRHLLLAWASITGVDLNWLDTGEDTSRARRDSNPQPSDLWSARSSWAVAA